MYMLRVDPKIHSIERLYVFILSVNPLSRLSELRKPFYYLFHTGNCVNLTSFWSFPFPMAAQTKASQKCTVCLATQILYPVCASLHQVKHILEDLLPQVEMIITFAFSHWINHSPYSHWRVTKIQVSCALLCTLGHISTIVNVSFALTFITFNLHSLHSVIW